MEVLPKSPIGKAVTYALNQWEALNRYLENGILCIDNSLSERIIKLVALGRNYVKSKIMRSALCCAMDGARRGRFHEASTQVDFT